jgi:hypothetical protein
MQLSPPKGCRMLSVRAAVNIGEVMDACLFGNIRDRISERQAVFHVGYKAGAGCNCAS